MTNLIFSLNATMPVFLTMVIGFAFSRTGVIDGAFASKMNTFVFKVALPVMLFLQLATTDFVSTWDPVFVFFCFAATLLEILLVTLISRMGFLHTTSERGEFIQAAYRSSAAILGIAYITNIYGDAGMAPMMIIGSVPLYNAMAVIVLQVTSPGEHASLDGNTVKGLLKGIITNPIILGIIAGMAWSLLKLPIPEILNGTLNNLSKLATPMGLLAMGASIDPGKVQGELKPAIIAGFLKLAGLAAIFLTPAVLMGFRTQKLVAILIMLGSPTTVSSFVMARNMGHDGTLTSNTVVLATVFSAFTLTFWIWLLRTMALI